jgi:hypothetical protein
MRRMSNPEPSSVSRAIREVRMPRGPKKKTPEETQAAEAQIVAQTRRIEFYITEYSVEILANKVRDGEYVVPGYQRAFTWEPQRKSRFLESLIMGLPIPFLFFWEMPSGNLEIVDGSQRLRTLEEFIYGNFRLGDLDQLTSLAGFTFSDLPLSRQKKILNRSIRGIVLNENADEAARFDMFERINTSSKTPNPAEVRRGALAGPFLDLVIELSGSDLFKKLAPISGHLLKAREAEELVTRFFAYGDGFVGYRDRPADFIFTYSKATNERFVNDPALADEYRQRFTDTMGFVERNFPHGFRKTETANATPRARFEAIAIGSYLAMKEDPTVADGVIDVSSWITSDEFIAVTGSDGANALAKLRGRILFVKDRLLES